MPKFFYNPLYFTRFSFDFDMVNCQRSEGRGEWAFFVGDSVLFFFALIGLWFFFKKEKKNIVKKNQLATHFGRLEPTWVTVEPRALTAEPKTSLLLGSVFKDYISSVKFSIKLQGPEKSPRVRPNPHSLL